MKLDITPQFETNEVPIVITPHKGFIPCMGVLVQSIIENSNENFNYDIVVLHKEVDENSIAKFHKQIEGRKNFSIRFFNIKDYSADNKFFKKNERNINFPSATYYRLFIPELFQKFEKVIYMDADMIALADVAELIDISMGDNLVAAVRDICGNWNYYEEDKIVKKYRDNELCLKNPDDYFNAGMVVFNIKEFVPIIDSGEIWKKVNERKWRSKDQDILNMLCNGRALLLPFYWNMIRDCRQEAFNYMQPGDKAEWETPNEKAKIVHFAGGNKPWNYLNVPFQEKYWEYAKKSLFLEENFKRIGEDQLENLVRVKNLEGKIGYTFIMGIIKDWILVRYFKLIGK